MKTILEKLKVVLSKSLFLLFCGLILFLCVKGLPGNPTSQDVNKPAWSKDGPLEPSIEGGRFALLYSIAEERRLEFSENIAKLATPDLGYRDGKYVSLFAPGVSIIAIPGYIFGKILGASQVGSFATIGVFALLNVYLLRKISIMFGADHIASTIGSLAFIFASPAFAYATTLYQHHVSTFLILLCVYILMRFKGVWALSVVWFIYALGFVVDYPNLILMFPVAIFALLRTIYVSVKHRQAEVGFSFVRLISLLGIILPLVFMLWYNNNVNGSPIKLSGTLDRVISMEDTNNPVLQSELIKERFEKDKTLVMSSQSFFSSFLSRNMLNGAYIHFFSPDRGMVYFTPVMIFGFLGIFMMYKKWNQYAYLLLGILAFNIVLYSMWDDPQGGWAFGSRYFIPAYAILSVFISCLLTKLKNSTVFLVLFFLVLSYSIGVNTLGAVTSTTNPPKAEALSLEKEFGKEQKYTYSRNIDLLNNGESKTFVFQAFASNYITARSYYLDLTFLITIVAGFLFMYLTMYQGKKSNALMPAVDSQSYFSHKVSISLNWIVKIIRFFERRQITTLIVIMSIISIACFVFYSLNGMGLAYNDARSHLDIGRRVVESIKPGFAQLGSVWLPLPHLLMTLTVWNDFMWHSGLSGSIQSMASYVATGVLIYLFLKKLGVSMFGRIIGVMLFSLNLNILYMQSTAMTELPLIATMMAGVYELIKWHKSEKIFDLVKCSFWIMLSTLIRYDGWFLFAFAGLLIIYHTIKRHGYKTAEGTIVIFATLGGFGIFLWFLWNLLIFKDPLFFAFGSFSASAQQQVIDNAGDLATKSNLPYSILTYIYALVYNSDLITVIVSLVGGLVLWFDKKIEKPVRVACLALLSPFLFNVMALYFGHSVLFVNGLGGNSWFNVRYGLTMLPTIAIFTGLLMDKLRSKKYFVLGLILFVSVFGVINQEVVTMEDARVGLGGKNVTEVSSYLKEHATDKEGFVLLSAAKHDAIIFSSGLQMSRFIHEGTGAYWDLATAHPEKWARWIVLRTNDKNDLTTKLLKNNKSFRDNYTKVRDYPFAEVYELKSEFVGSLHLTPDLVINK